MRPAPGPWVMLGSSLGRQAGLQRAGGVTGGQRFSTLPARLVPVGATSHGAVGARQILLGKYGGLGEGCNRKSDLWITVFALSLWIFDADTFFPLPILEISAGKLISVKLFSSKIWIFYFRFASVQSG